MENKSIFKLNGFYLGFIRNGHLFSRDGLPLGWIEGKFVWDYSGRFRGVVVEANGTSYIVINRFSLPPTQRSPKPIPSPEIPPVPQSNISPISMPVQFSDGY